MGHFYDSIIFHLLRKRGINQKQEQDALLVHQQQGINDFGSDRIDDDEV